MSKEQNGEQHAVSIVTKVVAAIGVLFFLVLAAQGAKIGSWKMAAMCVVLSALVGGLYGIAVVGPRFAERYPLPPVKVGESAPGLWEQSKLYAKHHPGWPRFVPLSALAFRILAAVLLGIQLVRGLWN